MSLLGKLFKSLLWRLGTLESHDLALMAFYKSEEENSSNPFLATSNFYGFSQADEVGILNSILSYMPTNIPNKFVEFGVGDGTENNSLDFVLNGWDVWWFGNEDLALQVPDSIKRFRYTKDWITLPKLVEATPLLKIFNPGVISMDLDGNDYHFTKHLLESDIKPAIWVQEYNANLGPISDWVMPYDERHSWDLSTHWGASLKSFAILFEAYGYTLVSCNLTGVNAFFVRNDLLSSMPVYDRSILKLFRPYRPWFLKSRQEVSPRILFGTK
jgi:hypothetical protein